MKKGEGMVQLFQKDYAEIQQKVAKGELSPVQQEEQAKHDPGGIYNQILTEGAGTVQEDGRDAGQHNQIHPRGNRTPGVAPGTPGPSRCCRLPT